MTGTSRRSGRPRVQVVDPATFVEFAADALAAALRDAPAPLRHAPATLRNAPAAPLSVALSGGSTPGPIYSRLACDRGIAWDHLCIFLADERAVPPTDPASNHRLVRETLVDRLPSEPRAFERMEANDPDLEEAARRYAVRLPECLDLLVLGIGADGHTASLFPGSPLLVERERRVAVAESPMPPRMRLTITPPVIRAAREIVVLARGQEKADAVRRALQGPEGPGAVESCPARLALGGRWILDEEAAARL